MKKKILCLSIVVVFLCVHFYSKRRGRVSDQERAEVDSPRIVEAILPAAGTESEPQKSQGDFLSGLTLEEAQRIAKPWPGPKAATLGFAGLKEARDLIEGRIRLVRSMDREEPLLTSQEAYAVITKHISMVFDGFPRVYFEDDEKYYFSGGTHTYQIDDFSSGFAVDKESGTIFSW